MTKASVVWSTEALVDIETIFDFLSEQSTTAAGSVVEKILARAHQLSNFPESGAVYPGMVGSDRQYRFLIEGNYKIIYSHSALNRIVYVEVVFDTRRNPDELLISDTDSA